MEESQRERNLNAHGHSLPLTLNLFSFLGFQEENVKEEREENVTFYVDILFF